MASRKSKDNLPLTVGDQARKIVQLKKKYDNWGPSTKNPQYVDLCFKLGKCYAEFKLGKTYPEQQELRKKAFDILQVMVNTANEIDFKLCFEQMILYSEILIKPDPNLAPSFNRYQKGPPSKEELKTLNWVCNSLAEMKSRNFRPKQISECEIHVAIAYYKCKNFVKAYDYFMFSYDYKSRNLSENIIWSFTCCGIETMKKLDKKEDLLKFYKIRSHWHKQYANNMSEGYIEDMINLFELDWELYKHENLEESPYFNEVIKSIERLKNYVGHTPDNIDHVYIDLSLSLLNLGIINDWIPKLLISYNSAKEDKDYNTEKFRYHYCIMKYHFLRGENLLAVRHGMLAKSICDNDSDIECDPDNNNGDWNVMTVLGEANLELGEINNAVWYFQEASKECYNDDVQLKIFDKLSRLLYFYGISSDGIKICQEAVSDINQSIEYNKFISVRVLQFDPYIRMAHFLRRDRKFKKAKSVLELSVNNFDGDYIHVLKGILSCAEGQSGTDLASLDIAEDSLAECIEDFKKVIKNINNFKDLRSFLNRNRQSFELNPKDSDFFVDMFLRLSREVKKPLSLDMIEKVEALSNSFKVTAYLKAKFKKNNLIAPVRVGEIGGSRFSFHKGQELDPAEY